MCMLVGMRTWGALLLLGCSLVGGAVRYWCGRLLCDGIDASRPDVLLWGCTLSVEHCVSVIGKMQRDMKVVMRHWQV